MVAKEKAEVLRKADKPVLLVVNKMDNYPKDMGHHEFWSMGMNGMYTLFMT